MLKRFLPLLILVVACESNEDRLARLRTDEAIASLTVLSLEQQADSLQRIASARYMAVSDSLLMARRELNIIRREMADFMGGN